MRTSRCLVPLLAACGLLLSSEVSAQQGRDGAESDDGTAHAARLFVGAAAGSAGGLMLWWSSGGPFTSSEDSLGRLWLTTVAGSTVGALLLGGSTTESGVVELVLGASLGILSGIALTMLTANVMDGPDSEPSGALLVLSFAVGQGIAVTLTGG